MIEIRVERIPQGNQDKRELIGKLVVFNLKHKVKENIGTSYINFNNMLDFNKDLLSFLKRIFLLE